MIVGATSGVVILVVVVVLVLCVKLRSKQEHMSQKEKDFSADIIPEVIFNIQNTLINLKCCLIRCIAIIFNSNVFDASAEKFPRSLLEQQGQRWVIAQQRL